MSKLKQVTVDLSSALTAYIAFCGANRTLQCTRHRATIDAMFEQLEERIKKQILNGSIDMPNTFSIPLLYNNREKNTNEIRTSANLPDTFL